ncbi:hypothetical protein RRG08_012254 [Elysia crispata]|uniref:Ig-like domain-containing protein n=1 Tax=Elysia crispata TaxID=231223 RepID=A0AAE0YY90_9GAST|nr:hypothetical protein RRG08_012254 [Elysia crispata]
MFQKDMFVRLKKELSVTNPSTLTLDDAKEEGKPLVLNCNADIVGLSSKITPVLKLSISRQIHGRSDVEFVVSSDSYYLNGRKERKFSAGSRDWVFHFSGYSGASILKPRAMDLWWDINDADCVDTGIYQCTVDFMDKGVTQVWAGQKNITFRGAVRNMKLTAVPQKESYTDGDSMNLTCTVDGPRSLQIMWRMLLKESEFEHSHPVPNAVVIEVPPQHPSGDCDSIPRKSILPIKMTTKLNGSTYFCVVGLDGALISSANTTLNIVSAAEDVIPEEELKILLRMIVPAIFGLAFAAVLVLSIRFHLASKAQQS